ncbi:MAG: class I SAM-dependent methyltransferase [Betaproteobacteria bacterium]|nr:class I SAM-dependent methyltransferase [Betaproteobacteria bacterium]
MKPSNLNVIAAVFFSMLIVLPAGADVPATEEVPYVQTPDAVVETMLDIAGVRANDFLIDLGSGDGRIVITAARRHGARGLGIDYDPRLVQEARGKAQAAGVSGHVAFAEQNLFETDLRPASVITMYLLPDVNLALRPKILSQLKPGTRVVSHDWDMGEWKADAQVEVPVPDKKIGLKKSSTIYLWLVPARVEGRWRMRLPPRGVPVDFELRQKFQEIAGTATIRGNKFEIDSAVLRGNIISFRIDDGKRSWHLYGTASAGRMVGQVGLGGRAYRWRALRADSKRPE